MGVVVVDPTARLTKVPDNEEGTLLGSWGYCCCCCLLPLQTLEVRDLDELTQEYVDAKVV